MFRVTEAFHFKAVAASVFKEHSCLLTRLSCISCSRLYDEFSACVFELSGELMEAVPGYDTAKVGNGYSYCINHSAHLCLGHRIGNVQGKLISIEIEIYPRICASSFRTTKGFAIKFSC